MASDKAGLVRLCPKKAVTRTYWTVWNKNQRSTRRVRTVADLIEKIMREDRALVRPLSDE
ncbi:hypothetical protein ACJ5NV_17280 [Loktanella agnita]|uniref:hypothetical protein n=1 Tax=Loktanella agnita TaxID=287097 RepID=UPI003989135C